MRLQDPLTSLKGVGPANAQALEEAGLKTVQDLINYWPRRYEDYSKVVNISEVRPGKQTIRAKLSRVKSRYVRRGMHITEALASDSSGSLSITWFNQPYREKSLKFDHEYFISGDFDMHSGRLNMTNPSLLSVDEVDKGQLIFTVYPETKKLNSKLIRRLMLQVRPAMKRLPETLPDWLVAEEGLISRGAALEKLHFPAGLADTELARNRLSFEELFELQLSAALSRAALGRLQAPAIEFRSDLVKDFVAGLAFELTDDQRRVAWQVYQDMAKDQPMNRLVEGDVGSGKTVIAAMAAISAMAAGFQVLLMAPTEILARQHAESLSLLLANSTFPATVGLLVGSLKTAAKKELHQRIASGECRLVVGTHALIEDKVATENVGLVIVDEQHRFGVNQRQKLRLKADRTPHFLSMTATPIPRTLALTLYGELDISIIETMPAGRLPTITEVVTYERRIEAYKAAEEQLALGRQAFIVCPLISDSASLEVQAAESLFKEVSLKLLKKRRIALVHGRLKSEEKEQVMSDFAAGRYDALVATTVIEVGVNVPNASVMIIEGAERFGLAQLHQLRGRIGRAEHQGYCYLLPSQGIGLTRRLAAMQRIKSGFELAEMDLELRGPGAIYGTRQSGSLDLQIAELSDRRSVQAAKIAAERFITKREDIQAFPKLAARVRHFQSVSKLN